MKRNQHPTSNLQHPTPNQAESRVWEFNEGGKESRKYDLEERLLEFASAVIDLAEALPTARSGNHVANQILRSGTSPYPNHGEAEEAESRDDFVHKMKICPKELRETRRWARLIKRKDWISNQDVLNFVLSEADELIRIFYASIQTAKHNDLAARRKPPQSTHHPPSDAG
ncbi:MAG TPA: four helix bundle protein [Verrucomicrobiae bacterium]|nr:four helix bundle protein [Verrucomicrobiae bacterium]